MLGTRINICVLSSVRCNCHVTTLYLFCYFHWTLVALGSSFTIEELNIYDKLKYPVMVIPQRIIQLC